jgi:exonuclease SbcC
VRPSKLSVENFGPYRRKTCVDFEALGEFFLICGPTGSGKSTLFDAMTYCLFGQAPGGRGGFEAELVSDFAPPGEKPLVEFEFSLSGSTYRIVRQAPYAKPKRVGGLTEVPPAATLFIGSRSSDSGWKVLADGVKPVNRKVAELVGLNADEFSKIILLPQGEFQQFLEMDSTKRSQVLEKLFPVDLHERITELARTRAQEAKNGLSSLGAELARLETELGEEPGAELERLRKEQAEARRAEDEAAAALGRSERRFELERSLLARRERAGRAAGAVRELLGKAEEEKSRLGRIELAKAAAAARPFSLAFSGARAKAEGLGLKSKQLTEELANLELESEAREESGRRAEILEGQLTEDRKRLYALEKALQLWRRRLEADEGLKVAKAEAAESDRLVSEELGRIEEVRREIEALRPAPGEEVRARAKLEELREQKVRLSALKDVGSRRLKLLIDAAELEGEVSKLREDKRGAEARVDKAEASLSLLEKEVALAEAGYLAAKLKPGQPCPVCGSLEHPALAPGFEGKDLAPAKELAEAREERIKAAAGLASMEARLGLLNSRLEALSGEIAASGRELGRDATSAANIFEEYLPGDRPGISASALERTMEIAGEEETLRFMDDLESIAVRLEARRDEAEKFMLDLDQRREKSESENSLVSRAMQNLELLRFKAEESRRKAAVCQNTLLEIERGSGSTDPNPAWEALSSEIQSKEKELEELKSSGKEWEEAVARVRTRLETILPEEEAAREELGRSERELAEVLAEKGFLAERDKRSENSSRALAAALADAQKSLLPPVLLAAEEKAALAYRENLAAAQAAAETEAAQLAEEAKSLGDAEINLEASRASIESFRQARDRARLEGERLNLQVDRLEKALARRSNLLEQRTQAEEEGRNLYGLSELLRGEISGRRLPFKNYVLAMYFSQVIRRASTHLSKMSEGRYYLKPEEGQSSGRGRIGLGLRVLDSWTGQDRPSGTLSGGEKFLTSISLALGLADSLRERSGAVSLESVFIDEGFGSLDVESLDRAIRVLDKIRGSRVIGIVSHVPELKSRIPARIEVEKGSAGSTLRQYSSPGTGEG